MRHGGLEEMLRERRCCAVGGRGWDRRNKGGEYVSGLADYAGDPEAFCRTRVEAEEKMKRKELMFTRT
jgi:hypothetical protein